MTAAAESGGDGAVREVFAGMVTSWLLLKSLLAEVRMNERPSS